MVRWAEPTAWGSSPLARGLPPPPSWWRGPSGIIPARAGFTRHRGVDQRLVRDHPRSRGVYPTSGCRSTAGPGSSPLARGLHRLGFGLRLHHGIIPARAGFTTRCAPRRTTSADHPRSRGVYEPVDGGTDNDQGSSPLARGLLKDATPVAAALGIIPARAGFTFIHVGRRRAPRDHPRSRGVYQLDRRTKVRDLGSSPLARGLPPMVVTSRDVTRIIPARAGFTGPRSSAATAPWDHPRSRGVYTASALF